MTNKTHHYFGFMIMNFSFKSLMFSTQILYSSQVLPIIFRTSKQLFLSKEKKFIQVNTCSLAFSFAFMYIPKVCWQKENHLKNVRITGWGLQYLLDPGLFIINVSEQLLKIVGFLEPGTSLTCHVCDPERKKIQIFQDFLIPTPFSLSHVAHTSHNVLSLFQLPL